MSTHGIRHFLDLIDIPRKQLRDMIDVSRTMKKKRGSAAGKRRSFAVEHSLGMGFRSQSER